MAIGANSYGSTSAVGGLVKKYSGGTFDTTTHPTLIQVEGFIDRVSGIVNVMLAQEGYAIPVVDADGALALDEFVNQIAAALCEEVNSAGRFFSEKAMDTGTFTMITQEAEAFIVQHSQGFEDLGAARSRNRATAWMGDKPIAIAEVA